MAGPDRPGNGCVEMNMLATESNAPLVDVLDEVQSISMKAKYPLSLAVSNLPNSPGGCIKTQKDTGSCLKFDTALILAVGSTDRAIQVFTLSDHNVSVSVFLRS